MDNELTRARYRELALVGALIGLHLVLGWILRSPGISWHEDDARYINLGREILTGGYAERWYVHAPTHAVYPPGFPALLALANVTIGDSERVFTALVLICSAASIALFYFAVRRHFGTAVAFFVTALTAINWAALLDAGYIVSEAPFRFWATLTLWAASREKPGTSYLAIAGASAVVAALTRTVGVAVIAGLALHWILERRWKAVALLAVGSIPVGLWLIWTVVAPDTDPRSVYLRDFLFVVQETSANSPQPAWVVLLKRILAAAWLYARSLVPEALSFVGLKQNPIDNVVWGVLMLVTVPLGVRIAWQRWRLLVLVVMCYGAVLLLYPWTFERFISPISSMLLVFVGAGVVQLLRNRSVRAQGVALAAAASFFVVGSVQRVYPAWQSISACDRTMPVTSAACYTEDRRGLLQLAAFVRERTPSDAVFFTPKEAAFYLHTGRRSVPDAHFSRIPGDSLGSFLRRSGVAYTVVTPIGIHRRGRGTRIAEACREFETVASFDGDAILLRLRDGGPIDHDDATCRSLAAWNERASARWGIPR
jgi:4-amino-4-deoxy-L-arabinose transferase-like glycosyltransferase